MSSTLSFVTIFDSEINMMVVCDKLRRVSYREWRIKVGGYIEYPKERYCTHEFYFEIYRASHVCNLNLNFYSDDKGMTSIMSLNTESIDVQMAYDKTEKDLKSVLPQIVSVHFPFVRAILVTVNSPLSLNKTRELFDKDGYKGMSKNGFWWIYPLSDFTIGNT